VGFVLAAGQPVVDVDRVPVRSALGGQQRAVGAPETAQ
jgi:hypothetical protein